MTGVQTCALPICFPVTIGGHTSFYVSTSNVLYGTGDNYFANLGVGTSGANTGYTVFTAVTE